MAFWGYGLGSLFFWIFDFRPFYILVVSVHTTHLSHPKLHKNAYLCVFFYTFAPPHDSLIHIFLSAQIVLLRSAFLLGQIIFNFASISFLQKMSKLKFIYFPPENYNCQKSQVYKTASQKGGKSLLLIS